MPIYCYETRCDAKGCAKCRDGFEVSQRLTEAPLRCCPECHSAVYRVIQPPALGRSASALDDRAKAAGFSKLKKLGKGEYERKF